MSKNNKNTEKTDDKSVDTNSNTEPALAEKKEPDVSKIMTPEEQAIATRVMREQDSWENIKEEEMVDFSLSNDKFALPPEAQKLQNEKKFAFRFIEMTPKRMDEVTNWPPPQKWWIVNRTICPELAKYCDPIHGAVQKEDQVMVMKPYHLHRRYEDSKRQSARDKLNSGALRKKHGQKDDLQEGVTRSEMFVGDEYKISGGDVVVEAES